MFQISPASTPRVAVSALSALAALGSSGTATGAPIELQPSAGAFGVATWTMATADGSGMRNWLTYNNITYHASGPAFARWNVDFASNNIVSAQYRVDANGTSANYGIPVGAVLTFALVTENWSSGVAAAQSTGPLYGTTQGVDFLQFTSTSANGDANYNITSLLQTWDANPTAYFGVRFFITSGANRGGVRSPGFGGSPTGNLVIDMTAIPEPTSLASLGGIGLLALRRRRA